VFSSMIEITTAIGCRLNCKYCPQNLLYNAYFQPRKINNKVALWDDGYRPKVMSFDLFKKCIDKIPLKTDIHFSGMCEPWQNPDCTEMLLYAHKKGHRIHVFTTLQGMSNKDYQQLKDLSFCTFVIHIPDLEGNSHFSFYEEYIHILNNILLDAESGAFSIDSFSCHGDIHPLIKDHVLSSGIKVNRSLFDRAGNVSAGKIIHLVEPRKGKIICKWCNGINLDKNVLLPDGTILLCCMDYGIKYPLGNLMSQSYEEISTGYTKKYYQELMNSETQERILCRTCHRSICI